MAEIPNLWPEELGEEPELIAPRAILKHQASELGRITGDVLRGRLSTSTNDDEFEYSFKVFVPTLDYSYELFTLKHGIEFYPMTYYFNGEAGELRSQEELYAWLQRVFDSAWTKSVINKLRKQATA